MQLLTQLEDDAPTEGKNVGSLHFTHYKLIKISSKLQVNDSKC